MKRLTPSLREKKRYLVFDAGSADKNAVFARINNALRDFLGILGLSFVNPVIMQDKFSNGVGILRINNPYKDEAVAALSLAGVKIISVSGILKKAVSKMR